MLRSKPEMGHGRTALGCDACGGFKSTLGSTVRGRTVAATATCRGFEFEVGWSGLEMRSEGSTGKYGARCQFKFAIGAALGERWATDSRGTRGTCGGFDFEVLGNVEGIRHEARAVRGRKCRGDSRCAATPPGCRVIGKGEPSNETRRKVASNVAKCLDRSS
jgi:hypothetical protein